VPSVLHANDTRRDSDYQFFHAHGILGIYSSNYVNTIFADKELLALFQQKLILNFSATMSRSLFPYWKW
jgi:hypothetical protein